MSESQPGQPSDPSLQGPLSAAEQARFELTQEPVTPEGNPPEPRVDTVPAPAYEHLGELPATYGTQSVYLVAYDPRQLFAYWDVDWNSAPDARYRLHVCRPDGEIEDQVEITAADAGRYLPIRIPGGTYYVELGTQGRDGAWQPTAFSARVTMPPEGLSGEAEPKFATLPFHLSFQRLLELIQNAMGTEEDLTDAMARLQRVDQPQVAALLGQLGHLSGDQLHTLETLLGKHLQVEGGASPGGGSESNPRRDRQEAGLAAGAAGSENLSSARFGSEGSSSGAFGREQTGAGAFGSEGLTSRAFGREQAKPAPASGSEHLALSTLSSGAFLAGRQGVGALGSETLSSGGFGSEALSSGALGSEAWRLAQGGLGGGSDLLDSERAALFRKAMENNLEVLGSLFSAFGSPGASDGFSAGYR